MKKLLILLMAIPLLISAGCNNEPDRISDLKDREHLLVVVDKTTDYLIYADKYTRVMYLDAHYVREGLCVMLNADGTPRIWEGEIDTNE